MVERRGGARFLLEALQPVGIGRHGGRQHLDGDVAAKPAVPRPVDDAHAAGADLGDDLVRSESGA
jgi:hypothetical protein